MSKYRKEDFRDLAYALISVVIIVSFIVWTIKTLFIN